jgi:hypothetical protein
VGSKEKQFILHKTFINTSGFFQSAMAGDWQEARDNAIRLPEQETAAFHVYSNWIYCGEISLACEMLY